MNALHKFALLFLTLMLVGIGAIPAAAVDYTVTGTITQDPNDPVQIPMINGSAFVLNATVTGSPAALTTTSTESEATYNASSMQFALNDDPPASCTGTPTLTLLDAVSGSDHVSVDPPM